MSSIEEQLQRDIAAVTQGVIVTEQHLREARNSVDDRIEVGRQRDKRRGVALAAAAAVVVPIVGLVAFQAMNDGDTSGAPTAPPTEQTDFYSDFLIGSDPTVDLVTGVWRQDNAYMLLWFKPDGSVQFNDEGALFGSPSTTGTYVIDGEHLTITTTRGGADGAACAGTQLVLRASVPEAGSMRLVNAGKTDACGVLSGGAQWVLEQVLPSSDAMTGMRAGKVPFDPLTEPELLYGDWVPVGGGFVVEISDDGTYQVAGGAGDMVDQGEWNLTDQELTLTSGPQSATCDAGDRVVRDGLKYNDPGPTLFVRGTTSTNECGGAWAGADWFLLPNDRGN